MIKPLLLSVSWILFLLTSLDAGAQKSRHTIADRYFREYDFDNALLVYEDIVAKYPDDSLALLRAGMCCRNLGNNSAAANHLGSLVSKNLASPEMLIEYADALKCLGKYEEAGNVYRKYAELVPGNLFVQEYIQNPYVWDDFLRDSSRFDVKNSTSVNSPFSEFGITMGPNNEIYFSSSREEGKGSSRKYNWNNQSYLNLFKAPLNSDSSITSASVLKGSMNSRYHEGAAVYDPVNNVFYITRNSVQGAATEQKSEEGNLNLAIYEVPWDGSEFGKPVKLPFCEPEHSYGHPAISEDGNRMFLVSDCHGGWGGTDIWVCERIGGTWSAPQNMGFKINTPGDEMFPFITGNILYFASKGQPGLGGLDIFQAEMDGPSVLSIYNLGYPVNTRYDDFGIYLFGGSNKGFFSSNRPGGNGDDDIYEVRISKPENVLIRGTARDSLTGLPLSDVTIVLKSLNGISQELIVGNTDENGFYQVQVPFAEKIIIGGVLSDYKPDEIELNPGGVSAIINNADLYLSPMDIVATGKVYLSDTNKPISGATVILFDEFGSEVARVTTKNDGTYYFKLDPDRNYSLQASYPEYITLNQNISTIEQKGTIYNDFRLFKPEKGVIVKVDHIHYDYDKADIRPDAAKELDRLVRTLKDNPTMKIELGSHTDCRGSDQYNLDLSNRRAKAVIDYLSAKGIDSNRLKSKGYGETKLLNKCDDGVNCSEEEHQENRRTEFKILDI